MKIDNDMSKQILIFLEKTPLIKAACSKFKIQRSTFYRYMERKPDYAKEVKKMMGYGNLDVNDIAKSNLISRMIDGDVAVSKFWLTKRDPEFGGQSININEIVMNPPLSEERKKEIYEVAKRWSEPPDPDEADCEIIVNSDNDESDSEVKDRGSVIEHTEEDDEEHDSKSIFEIEEEGDTRYR